MSVPEEVLVKISRVSNFISNQIFRTLRPLFLGLSHGAEYRNGLIYPALIEISYHRAG